MRPKQYILEAALRDWGPSLSSPLRTRGFWTKSVFFLLLLSTADLFVALFLHVRFTDLMFMEGILIFGCGAYIASGVGNMRRERWTTLYGDPRGHTEYLEDQRSKQVRDGIILMVLGAIITGLAIATGLW